METDRICRYCKGKGTYLVPTLESMCSPCVSTVWCYEIKCPYCEVKPLPKDWSREDD